MKNADRKKTLKDLEPCELANDEPCGCESGKKYSACCKKRKFKWIRNKTGSLSQSFAIGEDLATVLKQLSTEFELIFGRKPRKADPIFLYKYKHSSSDMKREIVHIMEVAGIDPAKIYAFRKTDRIVTDFKLLQPKDQKEYEDAFDEFNKSRNSGVPISELLNPESPEQFMREKLQNIQTIGGYFIDNYFNRSRKRKTLIEFVVGFAALNFVRCLRSILVLLESGISFDAFPLVRSLYENYLTISYLYKYPEQVEVFSAQLGVISGTHHFKTNKAGIPMPSKIVEDASNRVIEIPSHWQLASSLSKEEQDLYKTLYKTCSSFTHSEITTFHYFVTSEGFDYLDQDFEVGVLIASHLVSMLLFHLLSRSSPCQKYLKRDLLAGAGTALSSMLLVEDFFAKTSGERLPPAFRASILSTITAHPLLKDIYDAVKRN